MTESEALSELRSFPVSCLDFKEQMALDMAIEAMKKQIDGGWIPVEQRLPECKPYSAVYWVTLKNKFGLVCTRKMRWWENGRWVWTNGQDLGGEWEVIAWMPYEVPAPYQKGE